MRRQTVRKLQRGAAALVVSGVVLWLVAVTASSPTAREAMTALGREGGFALALLESQLGRWEDPLPAQTYPLNKRRNTHSERLGELPKVAQQARHGGLYLES